VKRWLRTGENHITVRATAIRGPSAVAVEIRSGGATLVETSATWKGVKSFGPVVALTLEVGMPKEISALDEYNQWTEAKKEHRDEAFSPLPDGYRLERLHRSPPEQGSWVSMAFDPKGGLVIAREKRGLLRLILADDKPPIVEVAEDSLLECRGLLFAHGVLYANANNSKALYKLRDTTDDGRFDEVTELMKTGGSVGHGRNDLALGPDGRLYSIHGDAVKLPSELHRTRSIGGAPGSEKGYLVSSDAQGGQRELVCVGLRNPYGIAFNHDGEPFTFDADNEGDIGLPLYRPTRVNHLVSGGNYGWWQVNGNQSWSVYAPDSLPTTVDIGRGSPTAVEFGYASHFPPRDREALFILDWAYGRILAVDLVPQGASYIGRARTFLRGRPLNVTDLAFGPEGAMYFITGGRGTRSALYRVRYEGDPHDDSQLTAQQLARAEFTAGARALRRQLEVYHGRTDPRAIDAAWLHLEDPDPWIRHAARTALEHQPVDRWAQRALKSGGPSALLALARVSGSKHREAIQRRAADIPFPKASRHQKLTLVRLCELTAGDAAPLAPHFPDEDPAVNRELSKLLVAQNNEAAVQSCLGLLAQADSQFETLHYLDVLSRAKVGLTLDDRRTFFRALEQRDYFRGDRNMPGYLKGLRQRATDTLSDNQRAALGDLLAPKPQDPPLPKPRPVVQHWTIEQLAQPPATPPGPNLHRGRKLFDQALCSRCHQVGGQGSAVGPNLTQVANRFSRRDLVEAIIEPSRAIAEVFQNLIVTKKDGTTVAGQLVRDDRRASTISLASSPFAPKQLTVVSKHDISSSARSPVSPMPPGLLDTLTREEIEHLLAFLQAGGAR
jgi:putative heme-binding domain-containing protein